MQDLKSRWCLALAAAIALCLPGFNTINDTLEWRLRDGVPFATVLRWFPSLDEASGVGRGTGSVLIVTQLMAGGGTCHVAQIDAMANADANLMAREAAERLAGHFDCKNPPAVLGKPGILEY